MMCLYVLMVGSTFCLDRAVHAPHGADACLIYSSFVDTFHVDSGTVVTMWGCVLREGFGETVLTCCSLLAT